MIENGFVELTDGVISQFGLAHEYSGPAIDLGDVALLPGWVNAHTHLEFSQFDVPFGQCGIAFTDWVRGIVGHRFARGTTDEVAAVSSGFSELTRTGTVGVGEIATSTNWIDDAKELAATEMTGTFFFELLGRDPAKIRDRLDDGATMIRQCRRQPRFAPGISPHAPYSVHPGLLKGLIELSIAEKLPLAMHLAETREELELLAAQSGPMVQMLKDFNAWFPDSFVRGERPLDYLKQLARAPRSLIIHGNYLSTEELNFIADRKEQMHVVFCPRTHAFFGHENYPLCEMLDRGINVALGTDSRGSNPDLNLLGEVQQVATSFPNLNVQQLLRLGTMAGAEALNLGDAGQIAIGCRGLNVASLIDGSIESSNPNDWIRDPGLAVATLSEFVSQ